MRRTIACDTTLILMARIQGLPSVPFQTPSNWLHATLEVSEALEGRLTLWREGLKSAPAVAQAVAELTASAHRFALAMSWRFSTPIDAIVMEVIAPEFEAPGTTSLRSTAWLTDEVAVTDGPPPVAPLDFPQLPLEARRLILTLAEGARFQGFVEERLRRHFLVIEELWGEFQGVFPPADHGWRDQIEKMRHFVSHPVCKSAYALVAPDLPSAVQPGAVKAVRFERTIEHRNYVARFETHSERIARRLVELKLPQLI